MVTGRGEGGAAISNLSPAEMARYAGQMALEGWGRRAQERLKSSRVFLTGAAGAAGAAAHQLLAAGVGTLRLVDNSRIRLADLSQQSLFRERDLVKAKAAVAEKRLQQVNPFARVEGQVKALSDANVYRLTSGFHLLGTSETGTAALLNLAAARHRLPLIWSWTWETEARLTTFWPGRGPCLACVPEDVLVPNSPVMPAQSLGPLPALVGSLMALEGLRVLGGSGPGLLGRLLIFHGRSFQFLEIPLRCRPDCPVCQGLSE